MRDRLASGLCWQTDDLLSTGAVDGQADTKTLASVEVPPGPIHWNVKVESVSKPLLRPLPLVAVPFDHGPPAIHVSEYNDVQVRVVVP